MTEDKLEKEIEELLGVLGTYENIDPLYMPRELVEIRHVTLFVHERIEQSLDSLYSEYVFDWEKHGTPDVLTAALQLIRIRPALTGMSFRRKLAAYFEAKIITEEMKKSFENVNKYRDWFGHGLSYRNELDKLRSNRNQQKQILETLKRALDKLNFHFKERDLKLKSLTESLKKK